MTIEKHEPLLSQLVRNAVCGQLVAGIALLPAVSVAATPNDSWSIVDGLTVETFAQKTLATLRTAGVPDSVSESAIREANQTAGLLYDSSAVDVIQVGAGDAFTTILVPKNLVLSSVSIATKGKAVTVDVEADTNSLQPGTSTAVVPTGSGFGSAYWNMYSNPPCVWQSNNTAWQNTCYKLSSLQGDSDPNHNWVSIEHFATAKSKSTWVLYQHSVSSVRGSGAASMDQTDYSPRADQSHGNCTSTTLGVSAGGVSLSSTHEACDTWDVTIYPSTDCHMKNEWQGSANMTEREVAYMSTCIVPSSGSVWWSLGNSYSAK
jgi:hypothetical protein